MVLGIDGPVTRYCQSAGLDFSGAGPAALACLWFTENKRRIIKIGEFYGNTHFSYSLHVCLPTSFLSGYILSIRTLKRAPI